MTTSTKSVNLHQTVYINLTEQGAYELARCVKHFVSPGWLAAPLDFVMFHLGATTRHEGGGSYWAALVEPFDSSLNLELPAGAEVATRFDSSWKAERR